VEKKLRICNLYPDKNTVGRNDGNPLYLTHTLRKMGHEVQHILPTGNLYSYGKFDLYLWCDWGEDALNWPKIKCPKPNAYWTSDTHLGYDYRLEKAHEFDYVFCAQRKAVDDFIKAGLKNVFWLPHAVCPDAYKPIDAIKKYDVCFVGHINSYNRAKILDCLFKKFPNFFFGQRLFEDAAEIFCRSKVVFNSAIKDDLNMRVFEVLATRSLLLTEAVPTLDILFKNGVHLVTYKNSEEMLEKAGYYIKHPEEAGKIAQAGYDEVMKNHTFRNRADYILEKTGLKETVESLQEA